MPAPARHRLRLRRALAVAGLALLLALVLCEALGWRFLRNPAAHVLERTLERSVRFDGEWRLHLLGPLRLHGGKVTVGAPAWSRQPHLLDADDLSMRVAWTALWHAKQGGPLRIDLLSARQLDLKLERLEDGRASWHFGPPKEQRGTPARDFDIGDLTLRAGTVAYDDAVLRMQFTGTASLDEAQGLQARARGEYRDQALALDVEAAQPLPLLSAAANVPPVPLKLVLRAHGTTLKFDGKAVDALRLRELEGRYDVQGRSLADIGELLGLTLPSTGPFLARGQVQQQSKVWSTAVETAKIGQSQLAGSFVYDPAPQGGAHPLLRGRLHGPRLLLADLAPAVGVPPAPKTAAAVARRAADPRRKVLPDARFNLPSLRNMNADLQIDLAQLDLGRYFSEPLQPFKAHLTLQEGVLGVADIDARTAKGSVAGLLRLDARAPIAKWHADLRWRNVRLEHWLSAGRGRQTPYVSGRFDGQAKVDGEGRSTAEILGSLDGHLRAQLRDGTLSHLVTEAAGLDLAQALGVFVKGDEPLVLECAQAQVQLKNGVATPQVLVMDTPDTTLWLDGRVSLKDETLDLHMKAAPKDFSPLSFRSPVDIGGSLSNPQVSIQRKPLLRRLLPAAALALVQPLTALIPLVDPGDNSAAEGAARSCSRLYRQANAKPPAR